ncbi:MAG: hypothetical protein IJ841_07150 [Prevotella sp.]|nr:hypothetical protein [Prevotella sp.]
MTKQTRFLLLLCCFLPLAALAEDTKTLLVVWQTDGSYSAFNLNERVKITFTDTDLLVNSEEQQTSFVLDDMAAFSYETIRDGKATITLSNAMGTFCSSDAIDLSHTEGVKAYVASSFDVETGELTMSQVKEAAPGTGLLIVGQAGTYEAPYIFSNAAGTNLLKGVAEDTEVSPTEGEYTNYILANGKQGLGFYRLSATGVLQAGKAYLQLPAVAAQARQAIHIRIDDEISGIVSNDMPFTEESYFSIDGLKVKSPQKKGIYIKRGKKTIIK